MTSSEPGSKGRRLSPLPIVRVILLTLILRDPKTTGYDLMKEVSEFVGVRLQTGTIYSELRRMEDLGLVTTQQEMGGRQKRIYVITERGRAELGRLIDQIETRVDKILLPLIKMVKDQLSR